MFFTVYRYFANPAHTIGESVMGITNTYYRKQNHFIMMVRTPMFTILTLLLLSNISVFYNALKVVDKKEAQLIYMQLNETHNPFSVIVLILIILLIIDGSTFNFVERIRGIKHRLE